MGFSVMLFITVMEAPLQPLSAFLQFGSSDFAELDNSNNHILFSFALLVP